MSRNAAPATKSHTPTTAPATQNESKHWSAWHMKRHLQCAEQAKSTSNLTKHCPCHEILKLKISAETPWSASSNRKTIRGYNPRIIRGHSEQKIVISHPPLRRPYPSHRGDAFSTKKCNVSRSQNVTKCCACREKSHSNFTKYCACHKNPQPTFTTYCACQEKCALLFSTPRFSLSAHLFSKHLFSEHLYSKHLFSLSI